MYDAGCARQQGTRIRAARGRRRGRRVLEPKRGAPRSAWSAPPPATSGPHSRPSCRLGETPHPASSRKLARAPSPDFSRASAPQKGGWYWVKAVLCHLSQRACRLWPFKQYTLNQTDWRGMHNARCACHLAANGVQGDLVEIGQEGTR